MPVAVVGIVPATTADTGLVDRRLFSVLFCRKQIVAAGFQPKLLSLASADGLAGLSECVAVLHLGAGSYPEMRGAMTAAVVARWVEEGGIWMEIAGPPFAIAHLARRSEQRWQSATDLFDMVAGYTLGLHALRMTASGIRILGLLDLPTTTLEATAGSWWSLIVWAGLRPSLSLVETDQGDSVLSVHDLGRGHVVRWCIAAERPMRRFLPSVLLTITRYLLARAPACARTLPAPANVSAVIDPLLVACPGGVSVGIAVLNRDRATFPATRMRISMTDAADNLTGGTILVKDVAPGQNWFGEAELASRPTEPVDIVVSPLDGGSWHASAVADLDRGPRRSRAGAPPQRPPDFARFWRKAQEELRTIPLDIRRSFVANLPGHVCCERVEFTSAGGVRIVGLLLRPDRRIAQPVGIVVLPGYSGLDILPTAMARQGTTVLAIDIRGQGASAGSFPLEGAGVLTHGLDSPEHHAYRGALQDGLRAIQVLCEEPQVDSARVGVMGTSQGGGLALTVGALSPQVRAIASEVPFLCDIVRSAALVETYPLSEWRDWCAAHPNRIARAVQTLSYFDVVNFVQDIRCPTFIAYSPDDQVCPAAGVRTAIGRMSCPLTVRRYGPGHAAPLLRRYRHAVAKWLLSRL